MDKRKSIRFDKYTYDFINDRSKELGLNFSDTLRRVIRFTMILYVKNGIHIYDSPLVLGGLSKEDRRLLSKVLVLCSRSSSNLNQSAHALNQIKEFGWLDLQHDELIDRLDKVSASLHDIDDDFKRYQNVLDKIINKYSDNDR